MVKVTVLMPVYNERPEWLKQSIGSILGQTAHDFELLILDDGSNEMTREILRELAGEDPRVWLSEEPHRGLTRTLNRGIALARGRFIARQDSDDWSDPERLSTLDGYLEAHPEIAVVGSDAWAHQENGRTLWRMRLPHTPAEIGAAFARGNPFVHGATMFRRDAALGAGGYREEFPCSQDYDFFWRLVDEGGGVNLSEPLYHYRYSSGSVSARRAAEQARVHLAARLLAKARELGEPENTARALKSASREIGEDRATLRTQLKQADHLMLAGQYAKALASYARLAAGHPVSAVAWGKLARWALFVLSPPLRELSFR